MWKNKTVIREEEIGSIYKEFEYITKNIWKSSLKLLKMKYHTNSVSHLCTEQLSVRESEMGP